MSPVASLCSTTAPRERAGNARKSLTGAARFLLPVLWLIVLALPSVNYQLFDGLPFSSLVEFTAFVLLLPLLFSRGLRRLYYSMIDFGDGWFRRLLFIAGALAVVAKLALLTSGTVEGFMGCYRALSADTPGGECERSYENPFNRFGATRVDKKLDFGERDWNLSFLNSSRFNYYPWVEGNISRDRIPIAVTWSGVVEGEEPALIEVIYVGEVTVDLGQGPLRLPASYAGPSKVSVPLGAGRKPISISFTFDDGYRTGGPDPPGPYAVLRLHKSSGVGISAARPPFIWHLLAVFVDSLVVLFLISLVTLYVKFVTRDIWLVVLITALGAAVYYLLPDFPWLPRTRAMIIPVSVLFSYQFISKRRRGLVLAYFLLIYLAIFRTLLHLPDINSVLYREAGEDFMTYESFARTILESGSLEGGEAIFFYQPLIRYIRFFQHFILGDGDALLGALALGLLNFGFLVFFTKAFPRGRNPARSLILPGVAAIFLLLLSNSWPVVNLVFEGAAEFPTWIFVPFLMAMMFASGRPRGWIFGALLLGLALITRTNHGPALLFLFTVFLLSKYPQAPGWVIGSAFLVGIIGFLPAIHNLVYGGELVLIPTSAGISQALILPPRNLLGIFGDAGVRAAAWHQFRLLFSLFRNPWFLGVSIALHGLQVVWLMAALWAIFRRKDLLGSAKALLLLPLVYLGVQFFYGLEPNYPRHVVMGHMAMGLVAAYVWSQFARSPEGGTKPVVGAPPGSLESAMATL